jgi:hypothetical protein
LTVNEAAATVPNRTLLVPVKPLPLTVTVTPPAVVPVPGLTPLTEGAEAALKVKWSELVLGESPL